MLFVYIKQRTKLTLLTSTAHSQSMMVAKEKKVLRQERVQDKGKCNYN